MNRLLIIFLLLIAISSFADSTSVQNDSIKTILQSSHTSDDSTNSENVLRLDSEDYYKLMYENAKEENAKLLSLLTNALTVIIMVILAIIGSSFFYNYRFNKKEFELLTKESSNKIEAIQKEVLKETKNQIDEITESNKAKIAEEFSQISETYKSNFNTVKDSLNTIINSFKQDVDKNIANHDKAIDAIADAVDALENKAKDDLKLNEKNLKIDILDIKAELYYMKEWYSLALSNYVDQANLCVETNKTWQLEYIVGDIINSIEKLLEKNDTITPSTKLNIEKLLPNIPSHLSDKKKKIEEEYKNITVKEIETPYKGISLLNAYRRRKLK